MIATSFARIHRQNLVNFGVLPLTLADPRDRARISRGNSFRIEGIERALRGGPRSTATLDGESVELQHALSVRQIDAVVAGGIIPFMRGALLGSAAGS